MQIFIPSSEPNERLINKGYCFGPFLIEAYQYHLDVPVLEKTQNLLSKKVITGTKTTKRGNTKDE